MSDLLSTVKILAGSTAEIAAASVGDQRLVAAVKLAEENNSVEIINGLKVVDVKAEVSAKVPEEAEVEEAMIGRSDLKIVGEELEELSSALHAVEETTVEVADDHAKSEEDSPVLAEVYVESPASSEEASVTEMESILELEESMSPVVMLSEDDTISGPAEVTSEAVKAVGQEIEEDMALSHEPATTETEHAVLTMPPTELEEALQGTTEAAEEVVVVMLSEDDTISGPAEVTSEAVKAVGQEIEEDIALSHEPAATETETETEHAVLTMPPTDLEEALQGKTEAAEKIVVEMMLDSVEEAKPEKASEEAVESGNVTMTMAQA